MSLLDQIKSDHELQRELMQKISATDNASEQRRALFSQFVREYTAHAAAEEHAFYAELMKNPDSTDQSRHSVKEHAEAMELLDKLQSMDMESSEWLTTFKALEHENEHHMEKEEEDVFPLARKTLGAERLNSLSATFEERKQLEMQAA